MNMHISSHRYKKINNFFVFLCEVLTIFAMVFYAPSKSFSQWSHLATHIFSTSLSPSGGALYFKDGILWGGFRQILFSRDTGKTWNVSLNSLTGGENVMNFDFYNSMRGLCRTATHLYLTQDGGATWNVQTTPGNIGSRYSIFAGTPDIVISLAQDGIYVSNDGGSTWTKKYTGLNPNIAAYKDYGTIAVYESSASRLVISHDFGQTWTVKPTDLNIADSYSMQWDKCDPGLLYLANEDYFAHNQNRSEIFGTGNEGNTWVSFIQKPYGQFNGGMTISPTAAYFQTLNNGVFATTDKGTTWDSLYGPSNYPDTRWLASVNSNTLIALDVNGDVWQLNTGSTGATPNFRVQNQLSSTNCRNDSLLVTIRGLQCRNFIVRNAIITGKDTGFFKLRTPNSMPFGLTSFNEADFIINFDSQHKTGSFIDTLRISWEDGETSRRHDTVFILYADVSQTRSSCIVSPQLLLFDSITPCRPGLDSFVVITNKGCDTMSILSQPKQLITGFTFDSLTLPVILPPDSSVNLIYHFIPALPGMYQTFSQIIADDKGFPQVLSVALTGIASDANFAVAGIDSLIDMDTVSLCSPFKDSVFRITNSGCVPMRLTKTPTIGNGFIIDSLNFPITIPSGSTLTIPIHFHPAVEGEYSQHLLFGVDWNGFGVRKLDLQLHGVCSVSKVGPLVADTTINFGITTLCYPSRDTTIPVFNRSCDTLYILSASSVLGNGFQFDNLQFPVVVPPNNGIMIAFHYSPPAQGNYQANIKFVTMRRGAKGQLSLLLSGRTDHSFSPAPLSDHFIDLGAVSNCYGARDTIITFRNDGCDTLKIISAPGVLGNGFTMDQLLLPVIIEPKSSVKIHFHFDPPSIGNFVSSPHFEFIREDVITPLDLQLLCRSNPGKSIFSLMTPQIAFAPLSICRTDSSEIIYTNSGCDTIYIQPNGLSGDADFIASAFNERAIGHGDTIHIPIHFIPSLKGIRSAFYKLHCRHRSGEIIDTAIAVTGLVTNGTKILVSQVSQMDFGMTRLCVSPDSTLHFKNNGCDTLMISAAQLSGSGFDLTGISFPIIIPPDGSTSLHIITEFDTAGKKLSSKANLTVSSTSDEPLTPITLSHSYIYPTDYPISLQAVNDGQKSGETFTLRIIADSLPKDLVRFDAKLSHEHPDMLFLLTTQSKNTITLHGDSLTITGNPIVSTNNIIAEFSYKIYLSKDSSSNLTLSDIHFNPLDEDYTKCMALSTSQSVSQFHFGYECGDLTLMMQMNGLLTPKIFSLSPNPAHGKIDLDLMTLRNEDVDLSICDVKGATVLHEIRTHQKGRSPMTVDINSLPSGAYFVRLESGGSHLSTTFIKEQ